MRTNSQKPCYRANLELLNDEFRSVYRLTAHVVFVIKYRRKAINNEILDRLKEIGSINADEMGKRVA
jgi:REP element-mobilizing transposase RayT